MTRTGRPRTGTVSYRPTQGLWGGAVSLGGGKRRWFYAKTEAEVRLKMALAGAGDPVASRRHPTDDHRNAVAKIVLFALEYGADLEWSREHTAAVLAHWLSKARVKYEIVGPCTYCGTELADSVDHVLPLARGGDDVSSNRVSACQACNLSKGNRTPTEWESARSAVEIAVVNEVDL